MEFARFTLGHLDERFAKAVEAVPESALNWQPGDETTNSIAQIVRHVVFGRRFMLGMALGNIPTFSGPPDARMRGLHNDPATREELLGLLKESATLWQESLAHLDAMDLTETPAVAVRGIAPAFLLDRGERG